MFRTLKAAEKYVGGLSRPSKMPGYSYGLSAKQCKTGSKYAKKEGTICSKCYALKGHYVFPVAVQAHSRRLESLDKPYWVHAMAAVINGKYLNYVKKPLARDCSVFRWHDSGDIQNLQHLLKIVSVVRHTPKVTHWLPTKELGIVREFLQLKHKVPKNLIIRLSTVKIGDSVPEVWKREFGNTPGIAYSAVGSKTDSTCVAYTQGGKCLDCRNCWSREEQHKVVSYPLH